MPEENVSPADMSMCECESCKRKQGRESRIRPGVIHAYSSQPSSGWVVRRLPGESAAAPTFGVELETDAPAPAYRELAGRPERVPSPGYFGTDAERTAYYAYRDALAQWESRNYAYRQRQYDKWAREGHMTADEAVSVAEPRGLWHPKSDSSVSGPEFASQPCTLAYWRSVRPQLTSMFRALLHGGMRSHDGDHCGFHVNIGTAAFDGAPHLERWMALIAYNERWSVRMSMRTHESFRSWANFREIESAESRRSIARDVFGYAGYSPTDHCSAVNASHAGRIEFRLPRGTIRLDRFYAKLEWVASMIEYTRDADNATRPSDYMRWVARHADEYPAVLAFMRERFNAGRFADPAPVARPTVATPVTTPAERDAAIRGSEAEFNAVNIRATCLCGHGWGSHSGFLCACCGGTSRWTEAA